MSYILRDSFEHYFSETGALSNAYPNFVPNQNYDFVVFFQISREEKQMKFLRQGFIVCFLNRSWINRLYIMKHRLLPNTTNINVYRLVAL